MSEAHEHAEHIEHAAASNKKIALLIAVIALFLAFGQTLAKSAQTAAISENVEAANLWAFFQAKTIRQTSLRTSAELAKLDLPLITDPTIKAAKQKQIDAWLKTVARYENEPSTGEGRKQLTERAREAEHSRDTSMARYHSYELGSAAFEIGIVLASAQVITGMMALAWMAGGLGIIGIAFIAIGLFAPHLIHIA
jgi:hypothetical protein